MNIIIVGDGKVGQEITRELSREGHDLIIIDSNPNALEKSKALYDVLVIQGNGASLPVLREAGAESADLVIAATSSDEVNMLVCILAKHMGTPHTIARIRNPEYEEQLRIMREIFALSLPINPELSSATEIYHTLQFPSFLHRDSFAKGRVEIVELKIAPGSFLCGIPLKRLYKILSVKVLICAVERKGEAIIPDGEFVLQEEDRIHITANTKDLLTVVHDFGLKTHKIKDVMIVGGSRIAYYLARMLLHSNVGVTIIEKNLASCEALAASLGESVTVIEGDGSNQQLLLSEGLAQMDSLITLTDMDEVNIFISLYGSHVGVPNVITKVNQTEYADVVEEMGIDAAVSPKNICAMEVVRYVRAMANTTGGSVLTLHDLVNGKVHALEFRVTDKTRHMDKNLMEMPIRKGVLLASLISKGRTIIPEGSSRIHKNDTVIIVAPSELTLIDLNDIFTE